MADLLTQLNTALAGHYRLDRELGRGGMATVYLAHDLKHDRQVALKVLHPELAASLGPERFLREIHTTARLQHPHILPVFDSGETSGRLWYTMPYVEGESLRDKLRREIQLPVDEAIRIVREVALALDYAHRNGVVHRDVKPENILLADGQALVADFGVARALEEGTEGKLTGTGLTVGTVAYMSPEQASDGQLDGRSDIYALGCVLYELLAGEIPFAGRTPQAIIAKRVLEPIPQVRTLREGVPPDVEKTLTRALAKVPADRFATAREFADALARSDLHEYAGPASRVFSRPPVGRALGLWAAATAAVGVTAWSATEVIGLPDWVLPGSLGVMLAGLPVIGITAFVQRAAYRAYAVTPQRASGSAVPAQGTLATLALKASPHVSWRRTWIGGGAAVGAFAVLVVGFMVTRAFGIGPAASLRGKGAFGAQETVIVADFRSPAGDPALGPTVAEALRTDLAQSSSLKILTRASVREILGLMQRPAESVVPFELAREIATREGAKAVLDGEIVQLGQSYVVSARLVAALDGQELATFRETAANEDALIGAMGDLSRAVREKAGESLRAIRASSELERVTTPSLPALRKYVEGSVLADEAGEGDRGLALLDEAVTLDTAFAMAWRKIAVLLGNENRDRTRALAAIATAYRHRERLTEQERLLTEGYYYTRGPRPDRDRALMAYEEAIRMDSTSVSALNNAAVVYGEKREYERAELLYRKVIALPRTFGGAFTNLMTTQIANGRLAALDSTAAAFRARFPDSRDLWEGDWFAAWGHGQFDRADSIGRAVFAQSRTARQAIRAAQATMAMAYLHGRLQEGLRWATLRSEAEVRVTPSAASRLVLALDTAGYAVLRGDASNGRAAIQRGLTRHPTDSLPPDERPWETLAELAGALGDAPLAHLALTGYERDLASTAKDPVGSLAFFSAHIALAERRWDEAVGMLHEAYSRFAVDRRYAMSQLGRAHDLAGRSDSAIVYYEKFLGTPDASPVEDSRSRGQIYRRLGELHEAAGSNRQAMEHYGRFVELWAEADPFLQPQVAEVRKRLEHLRAQVG